MLRNINDNFDLSYCVDNDRVSLIIYMFDSFYIERSFRRIDWNLLIDGLQKGYDAVEDLKPNKTYVVRVPDMGTIQFRLESDGQTQLQTFTIYQVNNNFYKFMLKDADTFFAFNRDIQALSTT